MADDHFIKWRENLISADKSLINSGESFISPHENLINKNENLIPDANILILCAEALMSTAEIIPHRAVLLQLPGNAFGNRAYVPVSRAEAVNRASQAHTGADKKLLRKDRLSNRMRRPFTHLGILTSPLKEMYMSNGKTKRLQPAVLQADQDAFNALKSIANYAPANQSYTIANVTTSHNELQAAQTLAVQTQAAADAARDQLVAKQWAFHDMMLAAKDQVKAQYGPNSDEVQSMGIKKKSEYKKKSSKKGGATK